MKLGFKVFFIYLIVPIILSIIFNSFVNNNLILANVMFYLSILFCFIIYSRKDIFDNLKDFKKNYKKYITIILKWILIEFIIMIICNYIIGLFVNSLPNNELNNRTILLKTPILATIYLFLIAPLIEEYVFRFSFKKVKNFWLFTTIPSLLFSSLHLLSITSYSHIWYIIPYFVMSFGFSNIFYKCQNYFSSVIGHIIHNILCVIIILVFR